MSQKIWEKIGLIYCPAGDVEWAKTHASVPIAQHLASNYYRIYFSSRDKLNRSYTGYIVVDIENPHNILEVSANPILGPGELGGFDDSGAMATWLVEFENKKYLYYIGWNLGVTVPFRNSIGLAISTNGGEFIKHSRGPILDRTELEPHFVASCCVEPGVDLWRMWYLSCTGWSLHKGTVTHRYHIKYAESLDGIKWERAGHTAIDYSFDGEYAISRPTVLYESKLWKMWYSFRGDKYRIGYAESSDAKNWIRKDHLSGIDVSQQGWDSKMIEYPFVFLHKGKKYMLYNGNEYGKTGFGLAIFNG
jgi:hypothetical protein